MTFVIPVKFAYAARDLWFDQNGTDAQEGDHVICSTERGTEIGLATGPARKVEPEELTKMIGNATLKPVLRVATDADLNFADQLARRGDEAFPTFRRLVVQSGLDMKPVGVEYLFGGEKVVCYFAADERVDFRQLVRDVSHELHQRIDMRQIGVREEAAVVGGFGHCGQELCCARFGLTFEPVSIRMAKEQDLPLTSNKISGACGRLMCCLRYEFEAYRDFKGRAPKRNAVIDTPLGKAKVVEYDTPKEQLALRVESGKVIRIPLAEMVASEAAVKKSEDLHCPCRPDTVVRASLEKLSSPDVQMALAELDRKNGVVPEDNFDASDIFVETKPRKRRNRRRGASVAAEEQVEQPKKKQQQQTAASSATEGTAPEKRTRRRRRKRSGANAEVQAQLQSQPQHMAKQDAGSGESADKPKETTRRRRRHRSAATAIEGAGAKKQGQQQPKHQAKQEQAKPKRRPGDRGGQKAQQQQQSQAPADAGQETTSPKRRRRRRRRSGGGGGGQGSSPAAEQ